MKIVQLNIWGGKLQYQIPEFLKKENPDIVCMQEVHDLKGPSGAVFATLDEIKQKCGYEFVYMSPVYSSQYQQRSNRFGNATLSKFKIKERHTIFTSGQYKDSFDLSIDDFNVRNFQHLVLDCGPGLNVLNHHGYLLENTKEGNQETLRQMKMIADYINKLSGPIILAGDFNLSPTSQSITELDKILINLPVEYGLKSTYNFLNSNNTVSDYIFVNDKVQALKFGSSEDLVSDHQALILEFTI
jgi:endonuclease/exonuclease/phosphatase family metal-dependent hydrolase